MISFIAESIAFINQTSFTRANRKRLGYTKFLDECKGAIAKCIEEELVK
jgi:hypothetical protein